jgi:signal transduction histidine kinase
MRDAQRTIVRVASHELRTPITVARGFTELIMSAEDVDQIHQDAEVVLGELRKLAMLSKRFVALAQADDRVPLRPERVDLDALLHSTVDRWQPVATRDWSVQSRAGTMIADPDRLVVAIDSLLDNAIRYGRSGGRISVVAIRDRTNAVICVRDDGSGIAAEELPYVFERFRRGSRGGTGIGLAIVRAVVDAHGGHVQALSAPELGSAFVITLPLDPSHGGNGSAAPIPPRVIRSLGLDDLVEERAHSN